jgi:hypothetical protein
MARYHPYQAAFNAGELSPKLWARTDFAKYLAALELLENAYSLPEGGASRRAGTRYVATTGVAGQATYLYPFQFSTAQAYMLEVGGGYFRFFRNQGQIVAKNITALISGDNSTFTSGIGNWNDNAKSTGGGSVAHDATNDRMSLIPGGTGASDIGWAELTMTNALAEDHTMRFQVIGAPGDEIELQIGTSSGGVQIQAAKVFKVGYHVYTFTTTAANFYIQFRVRGNFRNKTVQIDNVSMLDNEPLSLLHPYALADLAELNGPQSADTLVFFHEDYPTYKLIRNGDHDSWSLEEVEWTDGPYLPKNDTTTTLTPSAATGLGINLTLSSVVGVNNDQGWKSTDVGRLVRYEKTAGNNDFGYAVITSITSTTVAVADVRSDFTATPTASTEFWLGSFSGTTGYPRTGAFYEQRLFCAGTTDQPSTWWASQTADFFNMTPDNREGSNDGTIEDDDAIDFTLSADTVQVIRWMSAGEATMSIGTVSGEWVPESNGIVLTPSDVSCRQRTTHGSKAVEPVRVDHVALFVQRAGTRVREFAYSFEVDGFRAFDMTRLAAHITSGGISRMSYAEEPNSLVWAVRSDGQGLTMTYRREEDVVGWARHIMGGEFYGSFEKVWSVDDSAETFTDETTDAGDTDNADVTVFPASEAVGDYIAFGYKKRFTKAVFDYANGTQGIGGTVQWEYWDGDSWKACTGVTDNTTGFTATAADDLAVTWDLPTKWQKRQLSTGGALYYIRAKVTQVYTTNPIIDQAHVPLDPVIEDVKVIPGNNGAGQTHNSENRDEVWMIVKRTVNGSTVRYVEFIERDFENGQDQEDAFYVDAGVTYDSTATTTINSGLDHLEGEEVAILADGAIHPKKTVSSGAITLDYSASVVQIGLPFKHKMKTLKIEGGSQLGTAIGKNKEIFGLTFNVLNSHTISFGPDEDNLETIDFRTVADPMDTAVDFFTGEVHVNWDGDWESDPRMLIQSDAPVPFTLLSLAPETNIEEQP